MEFSRRDLMAVNIQRGRDHAVSDYNTARKSMGLEPITDVNDYISKTGTQVPREVAIISSFSATHVLLNQLQYNIRSSRHYFVCTITIPTTWTCGQPDCWRRL
jgi:Animal haem peroxidase